MDHPKAKLLTQILAKYDLRTALSWMAGIATVPSFQANSYRVEFLSQLVVACCEGKKRPTWQHLNHWLNRHLGVSDIANMEDPAEDMFVVNVLTKDGDFRVLTGLWEAADSATTLIVETLTTLGGPTQKAWLHPSLALLRLSDAMLKRAELTRWHTEPSRPKGVMTIVPATPLQRWAHRVTFHRNELIALNIAPEQLAPFVFNLAERKTLLKQSNQESGLHRRPLLQFGDEYVVALPNALTYAIRRYLLDCAVAAGQLQALQSALMICVQRRLFEMARFGSRHRMNVVELPMEVGGVRGICRSVVVQVGSRRFLHFLVVSDDLRQIALSGLLHPSKLSPSAAQQVNAHVEALRNYIESQYEVDSAHTLWLMGYLGQGFIGNLPSERPVWTFGTARLNELEMLFSDSDGPVDRLILLLNQEKQLEREGLELPFQNGLLNLYAFWTKQNFCLRISDVPHDQGACLQIATDFVAEYRSNRRAAVDEHCEITLTNRHVVVERNNAEAIYESLRAVPAYVSLDYLARGILSFCLKQQDTTVWLTVVAPSNGEVRDSAFKLWEALQLLLHKVLTKHFVALCFKFPVIEVTIDLQQVIERTAEADEPMIESGLSVLPVKNVPAVRLLAAPGFLRNFHEVENRGEQLLLRQLIQALVMLADTAEARMLDPAAEAINILGGTDARVLHMFRMENHVDYLLAANSRRVYRAPTEHINSAICSAFIWMPSYSTPILLDQTASVSALNSTVSRQAERLTELLRRFDRTQLISELFHLHETLLRERARWRYTARAVRALYGVDDGTRAAAEVERERAQLQIAIRALIEAAVCECPMTGGIAPDEYSLDELVGGMATLNNLGRDSDVVYYSLASKGITLFPNGSHSLDADVLGQLAGPYLEESFGVAYTAAATNYESWVGIQQEEAEKESKTESVFASSSFLTAWQKEYGHSFEVFQEIAGELQDLGVKRGNVVIETTVEEVTAGRADAGVTKEDVQAFVAAFGLFNRATWVAQPPYLPKDVNPWRFQRRLSLSLRPIVVCPQGTEQRLVYGLGTLRQSFGYLLDCIRGGTFDKDVFKSTEMRSFLGARVDALGRQFTERVASKLHDEGWMTATELKLTQLGASKSPNLGDIDVLAWHTNGQVLAIECKRLKQSKTIAEIALACARFKGNVDDHLYKHLRRAHWLQTHIGQVAKFIKLPETAIRIRHPMVVSRPVPFKYLQGLPIPASDILSFEELGNYLQQCDENSKSAW
ncbi:hypothetical protein [Methylocaldum sp.]|uniref:hypothetical protein n=1 Tax=Methylocaldum sp. TaxID=1969727 RepID=UPI002D6A7087|nr:hypothetical protein [Methylocaldum sp.]HYE37631.1 hypothetical protein [Methylocaldum sp.]